MEVTIKERHKKHHVSPDTLRYYEREGKTPPAFIKAAKG